jgi:hypothetical protein
MEYSHLLNLADECEDPHLKMVYACKYRTLLVALLEFGYLVHNT